MELNRYAITLRHDAGAITIRTVATTMSEAIAMVCSAEGAPHSAVISVAGID